MTSQFAFLKSQRFWALVIASLVIASDGGFTAEAWTKALLALVAGFISIRTVDRFGEFVGGARRI